jgi:hypothetical protein
MATGAADDSLRELRGGLAYWRHSTSWPSDLHNACYCEWATQNPQGNFTIEWWDQCQLPRLRNWRATRPVSGQVLTERFRWLMDALGSAWQESCAPFLDKDITAVSWDIVRAFPDEVARIKRVRSPVFTSKFCHFLLPPGIPGHRQRCARRRQANLRRLLQAGAGRVGQDGLRCACCSHHGTHPDCRDSRTGSLPRIPPGQQDL